eukprot:GHVS01039999.1.p1 GENE.GHVS01039999.1~~GHVS01039999.1.p1  ORF type:complete len:276 (+),score=2.98 GHVS01039999.1:117-944(+)
MDPLRSCSSSSDSGPHELEGARGDASVGPDPDCSRALLYVVVPYRDRSEHLHVWIRSVPEYLSVIFREVSNYEYCILIVQQCDEKPFNRGLLFNCAVTYIMEHHPLRQGNDDVEYLCFHDVDVVPQGRDFDFNYRGRKPCHYFCPEAASIYHLYGHTWGLGGVLTMQLDDYIHVGGFSNSYWGWGWEDNDFQRKCLRHGDEGGGHLVIRRHQFSERLAGCSNFRELDRTPVHLRSALPLKMRLPQSIRNKSIFDEDLQSVCFAGLTWTGHICFTG